MKKIYATMKVMLAAVIGMMLSTSLLAQRTLDVPQGVGTINETIFGDTLDNGDRVDSTTVYILSDGGIYLSTGEIENRFPLTIKAADGAAVMPKLYPAVGDGNESARLFVPRDDLTMIGIAISNTDELGARNKNTFRIKGDNANITLENCTMNEDTQAPFRLDGDGISVYINNCIISNMDQDYDNGRMIDDRGNDVDSISIKNSTMYNISSRLIRDDGGSINYFYFDHNTVVNTGRRVLDVGEVYEAVITNNIMKDVGVLGKASEDTRGIINIDSIEGVTQSILISTNSIFTDAGYTDLQPSDSVVVVPVFNVAAQAFVDEAVTGATMIAEDVEFTSGPAATYSMVTDWYTNPDANVTAPSFDKTGEPFDFGYANSILYAGATDDSQMGDPRWDANPSTGFESVDYNQVALSVYPMPVQGFANIRFELALASDVELSIFNVLGQKVVTLAHESYIAGTHVLSWNGSDDAGNQLTSGMYIVRLSAGTKVSSMKIMMK